MESLTCQVLHFRFISINFILQKMYIIKYNYYSYEQLNFWPNQTRFYLKIRIHFWKTWIWLWASKPHLRYSYDQMTSDNGHQQVTTMNVYLIESVLTRMEDYNVICKSIRRRIITRVEHAIKKIKQA